MFLNANAMANLRGISSLKKTLNVESPSFTPTILQAPGGKKATFSSQAASAPSFTPRGLGGETAVRRFDMPILK